jgi:hypothetical protein
MKQQMISRRDLIAGVSALAVAGALTPKTGMGGANVKDGFVMVNGWVLKRSETA